MAYGTESVPRVDKIFGPGNRYVTRAKQLVGAEGTAIDLPAGPSEVLVLADEGASPDFAAADLLSQAEHGGDSQAVLVCRSVAFARRVNDALRRQTAASPRNAILRESLAQSRIVVFDSQDDMLDFAEAYAPEHLIVSLRDPWPAARRITTAGSVFVGDYAPESAGDYASGTNHTLPHGRVRPRVQRREHRQLPAPHHLSGTHARRASRTRPDGRRHGPGRGTGRACRSRPHPAGRRCAMRPLAELVRPNIRTLAPYSTARDEYGGQRIDVWLDANESPYDNGVNRYPDPRQQRLREVLAARKGSPPTVSSSAAAATRRSIWPTASSAGRALTTRSRSHRPTACTASRRPSTTSNCAKCRSATTSRCRSNGCSRRRTNGANCCGSARPTTPRATLFRRRRSNGCCAASTAWSSSTKPTSISPTGPDSCRGSTNSRT